MTDFPRLLEVLHEAGVEYIIVGGLAATVHGSARLTQDIDNRESPGASFLLSSAEVAGEVVI
jgi:hypothetical protein